MKPRLSAFIPAAVAGLLVLRPSYAGPVQQIPVGPRAIAMGGAFGAVSDDYSAIFWNPAGLPRLGHQEISGTHADLYGTDIQENYLAFVLPITSRHAVAADWYHSGFTDPELTFGENRLDVSYGLRVHPRLSVGTSVKLVTQSTELDGSTVRDGNGFGIDVGLLADPYPGLRLGLTVQDAFDTEIHYSDGQGSAVAYPRNVRGAVSYTLRDRGTLALDLDDRIHVGAEVLPLDLLALRAGYQRDTGGEEAATWSFGAGVKWKVFRFDYAYEIHPVLDNTSHFGLAVAYQFNPAQIRIEEVHAQPLYASLHKTYASDPIGTVRIRNLKNEPLPVRIDVLVPGLMDSPTERELILRPRSSQEVPITAVLSRAVMRLEEDRPVQVRVAASYRSARVVRSDRASGKTVLYAPEAINWGAGVEQAAAFVTTRDPVVASVAGEAGRLASQLGSGAFLVRNIGFAAAMFDALHVLGCAYVPDPNNPYRTVSETEFAVDTVHYPRATLARRAGDCDDTSVLMAALLGNVGVPTKLVDAPGHLMILVGTGLSERQRLALPVDESLTVVEDGTIWIPLETTALGGSFSEAWRRGAEEYAGWASRGRVNLVDVTRSQARYEPALPPGNEEPPPLDTEALAARLADDKRTIQGWRAERMAERSGDLELNVSPEGLNEVAQVYYLAGRYEDARKRLEQGLEIQPGSAALRNNLGVVLFALGERDSAVTRLEEAMGGGATDPGVELNLGLALAASEGRLAEGAQMLRSGLQHAGGYREALALLGLGPGEPGKASGPEDSGKETVRSVLRDLVEGTGLSSTPGLPPGYRDLYWKP